MMTDQLEAAISSVRNHKYSFCKFVSPNDAGDTGGHQAGLYIPKNSIQILFDQPGQKGENLEKSAKIIWGDGIQTEARFIYYGKGTRNEYRITRLGRHFKVDDLVIITKVTEHEYQGFCLTDENSKAAFLDEFELTKEDTNSLISVLQNLSERQDFSFKPRARIIKVIGQELISNDVIALVELIKNSYDADATSIEIELNNIYSENGEILIKDNGLGMSYEKVVNVWLEPATPDKKSDLNNKFSLCSKRRLLGEKGIGRFAAHRLGDNIELITRSRPKCDDSALPYETEVKIDWLLFTENIYLSDVPITVVKNPIPKVFNQNSGTLLRISNIQPWKPNAVKNAVTKIKGLESPIKPSKLPERKLSAGSNFDPGITINITSNDIRLNKEISEIKSLSEVIETAFYKFSALISEDGKILYDYTFNRVGFSDIARSTLGIEDSLLKYDLEWFEVNPMNSTNTPGAFEITLYAWDLDASALKIAGLTTYYRNIIKPNSGVRIYRDGFRVWPYGEEDNDWLELDIARLNAPKERGVSRNQVFGVVHISSENKDLTDQSNREGLIVNAQYEQFYHLVNACLTLFARERKADKVRIDKVGKEKSVNDIVSESINLLRTEIEKNKHESLYSEKLNKIEKVYKEQVNDILERYMMAAAIGISYSLPIHEIKLRLTSIKDIIEDIERDAKIEDVFLRELYKRLNDIDSVISAVTSIMSRQKLQNISLAKVAANGHLSLQDTFPVFLNKLSLLPCQRKSGKIERNIQMKLPTVGIWLRVWKSSIIMFLKSVEILTTRRTLIHCLVLWSMTGQRSPIQSLNGSPLKIYCLLALRRPLTS